ncbi:MAG: CCA tRNA nucleotidyltransferase [Candidatus Omnitrophica bacterium]|nr:CCA tRNA nucleotidyltransferase [Candidatus Omnitrophota bacterium]
MKDYFDKLPQELQDLIKLASDIAGRSGMPAYLVGGFVRDLILGVRNLDLDIVVEGDAIKFASDFASCLKAKFITHRRFGTATVFINHGLKIDFATARKETYPYPASLPQVTFGSLRDDLVRRDFTINAMAASLNQGEFGKIIDLFNGREDLRNKLIRVLHDLSFIDDPTRLLRAVRFEQRYDFKIEPRTLKYLKEASRLKMLHKVHPQRVRDELILILQESSPLKPVKRLCALCGLSFIDTEMSFTKKTNAFLKAVQAQIAWFGKTHISRRKLDAWVMYFMALIEQLNISRVRRLCRQFVFRKGEEKRFLDYKKIKRSLVLQLSRSHIKPSRLFWLLEPLSYEVILLLRAKYKDKALHRNIADFLRMYNGMRIDTTGEHLRQFGLTPGPLYQRILRRVLNAKLNGLVRTKEEELSLVKRILKIK